ncbi:MAG: UDP-2,3-diacylglucosamine diphosphatase LpxI [Verrucomicrobiota bacterium]|nr:UDP-2,3-diacylglucosamine diphosphatase LpxI [Verrucomicrobiota bacterium]
MEVSETLGIIAGNGVYPRLLADAARRSGVKKIVAAAFTDETDDRLAAKVDEVHWMRVGQLGKLISSFRNAGVANAIMAGQIAPKNLFDLRPDWKTLLLLARLKRRNAESIFAAIGDELGCAGITLLPATSFLEDCLAPAGLVAGRKLSHREEDDITFGFEIAREVSRLDIGQTVIVKNGTVLAVEGFEGTNETIKRGGALGGKNAIMVKVAKPGQDMRFDVPVIGVATVDVAAEGRLRVIAVEAGRTLLLEKEVLVESAAQSNISIVAR